MHTLSMKTRDLDGDHMALIVCFGGFYGAPTRYTTQVIQRRRCTRTCKFPESDSRTKTLAGMNLSSWSL